jgi:hypothetical protein
MRHQIMDKLRMAGQRINDFDKAYAARAARDMGPREAHPIRHLLGGSPVFPGDASVNADSAVERVLGELALLGARGTNIGYRYGLPAAGVTLGAVGLESILSGLYEGASQVPVMPGQLPVN